jgi:hypothetical protein
LDAVFLPLKATCCPSSARACRVLSLIATRDSLYIESPLLLVHT